MSVIQNSEKEHWVIEAKHKGTVKTFEFDYVINACGFRTGTIDDMLGLKPQRMVEFKAAYVCHWAKEDIIWPEIIF